MSVVVRTRACAAVDRALGDVCATLTAPDPLPHVIGAR
jgi:hypothetical protein